MRKEFQLRKFLLKHDEPSDFTKPALEIIHPVIHSIIRFIFAVYTITFMIISAAWDHRSATWLTFATSWNYIIVTVYFICAFAVSIVYYVKQDQDHNIELPFPLKIFWVFYTTAMTLCTVVIILYWALLHDYSMVLRADLDSYLIIDRHGVILFLLIIDFFMHRIPFRILHFTFPFIVGVLYAIFNVSYWAVTDLIIYSNFDWNENPGQAAGSMVGLVFSVIIIHFIVYWVHRLKEQFIEKESKINNQIPLHNI